MEITVTGTYYNEITGDTTTGEEELRAVINLYEIERGGRVVGGGYFPNGGGILFNSSSGFDASAPTVSGSGTAHVNGFIAKGPFTEGSQVSITLIDEDMNRIEIDSEFISDLQGETDNLSEFSIELPATEDVDININLNSMTFLQTERMYWLIENENMSFYEAYIKSKEEILSMFNIETNVDEFPDFEQMDIREEGDGNAILFIANSMLTEVDGTDKQDETLLQKVLQQIKENGAVLNENIGDFIAQRFSNLDFNAIRQLLINYFQSQGQNVNIPNPDIFLDDDNDLIINGLDISIIRPRGEIIIDPYNPPQGAFEWTKVLLPPQIDKTISYAFEISENPYFIPHLTFSTEIPQSPPGNPTVVIDNIDLSNFTMGHVYYWRVAVKIDGERKRWSAATSFIPVSTNSQPTGEIKTLNGEYLPTRQVVIDNTQVLGANKMSFAVNGTPVVVDEDFELFRRIILPEWSGTYTISAQFNSPYGTHTPPDIVVDLNHDVDPSGSFNINGGATNTLINQVILDLTGDLTDDPNDGIKYAYMMKFSNVSIDDLDNQPWMPFRSIHFMELAGNDGQNTIYARFANARTTYDTQTSINIVPTQTLNLYIEEGLRIDVGHDLDGDTTINPNNIDIMSPFFPKIDDQGSVLPHEIKVQPGSIIYLFVNDSNQYQFTNWDTKYTVPTGYEGYYHYTVVNEDITMYAQSEEAPLYVYSQSLYDHTGAVKTAMFTPDGKIVSGGDGSAIVWEFNGTNWTNSHTLDSSGITVNDLDANLDSTSIITGRSDNSLSLWLWDSLDGFYSNNSLSTYDYPINAVLLDSNANQIILGYDINVVFWEEDIINGWQEILSLNNHTDAVNTLDIRSDDIQVVSGGSDNNIIIWEYTTSWEYKETLPGHTNAVTSVVYGNQNENMIVSGGLDQSVRIWTYDSVNWQLTHTIDNLPAGVNSVDIRSDDMQIVAGLNDNSIMIWNLEGGNWVEKTPIVGHTGPVNSVAYNPSNDYMILSASEDFNVLVWEYIFNK